MLASDMWCSRAGASRDFLRRRQRAASSRANTSRAQKKALLLSGTLGPIAKLTLTRFRLETQGAPLPTGQRHVVTVLSGRGKRVLVEDTHFATDSSLFAPADPDASGNDVTEPLDYANDELWKALSDSDADFAKARNETFEPPDDDADDDDANAGGLEPILAALKFASQNPDHGLLVAGHTDRAGTEAHNQELSGARADCVAALLEGDADAYVVATGKHDTPAADGGMLAFAARAEGFACAPADPDHPTRAEIEAFQSAYNDQFDKSIGVDGVVGDETRRAYFDVLAAELSKAAGGDDALADLRAKLKFVDDDHKTLACGERFPIDRPTEDGVASRANRRVEVLFFPPDLKPDLSVPDAADAVYHTGSFDFDRIDPETLDASADDADAAEDGELVVEDAPAPDSGTGELDGDLETEMAKLQEEPDPSDQYAFLGPFDQAAPQFGSQMPGDFLPAAPGTAVV